MVILWLWTALLSAFALYPALTGRSTLMVPIAVAAGALLLFTFLAPKVGRRGGSDDAGTRVVESAEVPRSDESTGSVPADASRPEIGRRQRVG